VINVAIVRRSRVKVIKEKEVESFIPSKYRVSKMHLIILIMKT